MRKSFICIAFAGLFMLSCQTSSVSDFSKVKQLIQAKTWVLQDENGNAVGFNGQDVTMNFHQQSNLMVSGFAGCNNYFASVVLLPDSMTFDKAGTTMMACPDMENEQAFLDLLSLVNGYEITGSELRLYQDKILLMRFKAK